MRRMQEHQRATIEPLIAPVCLPFHSDEELERLRTATLWVLENVGVRFPSRPALELLAANGAHVESASQVVRFPPDLVLCAMANVPRHFLLGARNQALDVQLQTGVTFFCNDGCGTLVREADGGSRPSTKADVAAAARLCDALSSVAYLWPMVAAQDCGSTASLHEIEALWTNSAKHVQGFVQGRTAARYAIEMATVTAGSEAERRRRPPLSALLCTVSPLMQDREAIEAALEFAKAGIPVGFKSMPTLGTTAPATMAGSFAVADAEVISATVLVQLAAPGAAVFHSILPEACDPRTGNYVAKPLNRSGRQLAIEIAHHWGMSSQAGVFGTAASQPGTWQSASEVAIDAYLAASSGAEMAEGIGLTEGSTTLALESLLLDSDIYHRARYALVRPEISEETLALDSIAAVGPGGHFLSTKHTRRHLPSAMVSGLQHELGADGKYRDPVAVARERAESILANHEPEPLGEDKRNELALILASAKRELH
jgi:trimethylamine--corrinoid protein Co-methyltransferase